MKKEKDSLFQLCLQCGGQGGGSNCLCKGFGYCEKPTWQISNLHKSEFRECGVCFEKQDRVMYKRRPCYKCMSYIQKLNMKTYIAVLYKHRLPNTIAIKYEDFLFCAHRYSPHFFSLLPKYRLKAIDLFDEPEWIDFEKTININKLDSLYYRYDKIQQYQDSKRGKNSK